MRRSEELRTAKRGNDLKTVLKSTTEILNIFKNIQPQPKT